MPGLRGQSELLSTVITVSLVLVIGVAGMAFSISWASSRMSEAALSSFAEGFSSDLQAVLLSSENRSGSVVIYILVLRIGVVDANYTLYASAYNVSSPQQSWCSQQPLPVGYSLSYLGPQQSPYSLSFSSTSNPSFFSTSSLYVKKAGSWYPLSQLGCSGPLSLSRVDSVSLSSVLVLNISYTPPSSSPSYLVLVLWAGYGDRYLGVSFTFLVRG